MDSEQQAKALIEAIQIEAHQKWGENWMAQLVRTYCEIESAETGQDVKPIKRRSQLGRVFEEKNATLQTLIRLTKAIGAELNLEFTRKEVKRFG